MHRDAEAVPALLGAVLRNRELLRLDIGIFALHAMLTASFLVVPDLLRRRSALRSMINGSSICRCCSFPWRDGAGDHRRREISPHERRVRRRGGGARYQPDHALFGAGNLFVLLTALVVFFSAFNVMEASLPSLITKVAPADVKGTAMGVYSSLQFFGIFVGGIIGGMAHQHGGSAGVFALTTALARYGCLRRWAWRGRAI